jgi:hypothetical protein
MQLPWPCWLYNKCFVEGHARIVKPVLNDSGFLAANLHKLLHIFAWLAGRTIKEETDVLPERSGKTDETKSELPRQIWFERGGRPETGSNNENC